jgi:hypothetical protein
MSSKLQNNVESSKQWFKSRAEEVSNSILESPLAKKMDKNINTITMCILAVSATYVITTAVVPAVKSIYSWFVRRSNKNDRDK